MEHCQTCACGEITEDDVLDVLPAVAILSLTRKLTPEGEEALGRFIAARDRLVARLAERPEDAPKS
jgi:hypothetical protein